MNRLVHVEIDEPNRMATVIYQGGQQKTLMLKNPATPLGRLYEWVDAPEQAEWVDDE